MTADLYYIHGLNGLHRPVFKCGSTPLPPVGPEVENMNLLEMFRRHGARHSAQASHGVGLHPGREDVLGWCG